MTGETQVWARIRTVYQRASEDIDDVLGRIIDITREQLQREREARRSDLG